MMLGTSIAEKRIVNVWGCPTEVLEFPATTATKLQICFLPGNPGVIAYYARFLSELHTAFNGQATVVGLGYAGHGGKDVRGSQLYGLRDQIEHKLAFLDSMDESLPVVLIGHSIGSYMVLEMLRKRPERVQQVLGIHPFITMNLDSSRQRFLARIARLALCRWLLAVSIGAIGLLPYKVKEQLVKSRFGDTMDPDLIKPTAEDLLQYHNGAQFSFLGNTEFQQLVNAPDWAFMNDNKERIAFLFSEDDYWGPITHHNEIQERVPGIRLTIEQHGCRHAFGLTAAGSGLIALECHKLLTMQGSIAATLASACNAID
eukprot:jgi/Chlat1/9278/Chrsp99S08499